MKNLLTSALVLVLSVATVACDGELPPERLDGAGETPDAIAEDPRAEYGEFCALDSDCEAGLECAGSVCFPPLDYCAVIDVNVEPPEICMARLSPSVPEAGAGDQRVLVNGVPVPRDPDNGWTQVDEFWIELHGEACDAFCDALEDPTISNRQALQGEICTYEPSEGPTS